MRKKLDKATSSPKSIERLVYTEDPSPAFFKLAQDNLILLLIQSTSCHQYLLTAKKLYTTLEQYAQDEDSKNSLKNSLHNAVKGVCAMTYVNHPHDFLPATTDNFKSTFDFLCGKHEINENTFLQWLDKDKAKRFIKACGLKAKKYQTPYDLDKELLEIVRLPDQDLAKILNDLLTN